MKYVEFPTSFSWYDIAVHSYVIPGGSVSRAIRSIVCIAWPELNASLAAPLIVAEGYRL